jgi:hypothetical protein
METEEKISISTIRELANKLPSEEARTQIMTLAEHIRTEGREEGREEGMLIGKIVTYREILGLPPTPEEDLRRMTRAELSDSLNQLKAEALKRSQA